MTLLPSVVLLKPDLPDMLGEQLDEKIYRTLLVTERLCTS